MGEITDNLFPAILNNISVCHDSHFESKLFMHLEGLHNYACSYNLEIPIYCILNFQIKSLIYYVAMYTLAT